MTPALKFTKQYMLPFFPWYLAGFLFVMGTQATMVAIIEETKVAIDAQSVSPPAPEALTTARDEPQTSSDSKSGADIVLPSVKKIILLAGLLFAIRVLSRYLIFTPGRMIEFRIRNDFFETLLCKPRSFFRRYETGDLISRASNDIGFIRAAYGYGVLQVVNVFSAFSLGIWAMWRMDPKTTAWIGLPMFSTLILIQLSIRFLFKYWRSANEQLGTLSGFCLASFQGVSAIQGFHAEPRFIQKFVKISKRYLDTNLLITSMRSFIMPLVSFSGNAATFIVLWIIGAKIVEGRHTVGQISAYLGYISMVMPPLLSLGWMLNVFNRAVPAIERLQDVLSMGHSGFYLPDLTSFDTSLEVRDMTLSFQSKDTSFSLEDVSFKLKPGGSLGIVGEVGSGKTALVEALLGFNPLDSGAIEVDGKNSKDFELPQYRGIFSFAPQRAFLFSTTLRENLLLGNQVRGNQLTDKDLEKALGLAGFTLDPAAFPMGLNTQVGEKGIMLSGGQRQRMALARSLLKPAQVFILDDVLSAVDHETERLIIQNLKRLGSKKTFIIVSHRLSAVQWCDEILVLDQGSLVDRGTHEELVNRSGYYQSSFQYQNQKVEA